MNGGKAVELSGVVSENQRVQIDNMPVDTTPGPSVGLENKWIDVAAVFINGKPDSNNVELYIN